MPKANNTASGRKRATSSVQVVAPSSQAGRPLAGFVVVTVMLRVWSSSVQAGSPAVGDVELPPVGPGRQVLAEGEAHRVPCHHQARPPIDRPRQGLVPRDELGVLERDGHAAALVDRAVGRATGDDRPRVDGVGGGDEEHRHDDHAHDGRDGPPAQGGQPVTADRAFDEVVGRQREGEADRDLEQGQPEPVEPGPLGAEHHDHGPVPQVQAVGDEARGRPAAGWRAPGSPVPGRNGRPRR